MQINVHLVVIPKYYNLALSQIAAQCNLWIARKWPICHLLGRKHDRCPFFLLWNFLEFIHAKKVKKKNILCCHAELHWEHGRVQWNLHKMRKSLQKYIYIYIYGERLVFPPKYSKICVNSISQCYFGREKRKQFSEKKSECVYETLPTLSNRHSWNWWLVYQYCCTDINLKARFRFIEHHFQFLFSFQSY